MAISTLDESAAVATDKAKRTNVRLIVLGLISFALIRIAGIA